MGDRGERAKAWRGVSAGAVFALLVVRAEGRIGPSIVAHAVVNTIGVLGLFLT